MHKHHFSVLKKRNAYLSASNHFYLVLLSIMRSAVIFIFAVLLVFCTIARAGTDDGICPNTVFPFQYLSDLYAPWVNFVSDEHRVTDWNFSCAASFYPDGRFLPGPPLFVYGIMRTYFTAPDGYGTVRHHLYLLNQTDHQLYWYQNITYRGTVFNPDNGPRASCIQQVGDPAYSPVNFENPAFVFAYNAGLDAYNVRNASYGKVGRTVKGEIFQWSRSKTYSQSYLHQWNESTALHQFTLYCDYVKLGTDPWSTHNDPPPYTFGTSGVKRHRAGTVGKRANEEPSVDLGKWQVPRSMVFRSAAP